MLHTQEKILRYELAQKRKLLTELKEELEYSREKWSQAREKNSNTEQQWRQLRTEFASRRNTVPNDNSVESGYSDDRESSGSSSDEEPGYETDVSESAQKASGSSDDVEDLSDTKEVAGGVAILSLIGDKIAEIVCSDPTGVNDVHSEQKTDSAQNQDSVEKAEGKLAMAGTSGRDAESEKCLALSQPSKKIDKCREVTELTVEAPPKHAGISPEVKESPANGLEPKEALGNADIVPDRNGGVEAVQQKDRLEENTEKCGVLQTSDKHERLFEMTDTSQELEETPGSSGEDRKARQSLEEVLAQRDERLKRLEGQAEQLVTKAADTANRSVVISNRLDDLHEVYGQDSSARSENSVSDSEVPSTDIGVDIRPTEDNQE